MCLSFLAFGAGRLLPLLLHMNALPTLLSKHLDVACVPRTLCQNIKRKTFRGNQKAAASNWARKLENDR